MDERLLALADVINSTRPDGSPRLQEYRDKKQRSTFSLSFDAESGPDSSADAANHGPAAESKANQHQDELSLTQSKCLKAAKKMNMSNLLRKTSKSDDGTKREKSLELTEQNQPSVTAEIDQKPMFTIGGDSEGEGDDQPYNIECEMSFSQSVVHSDLNAPTSVSLNVVPSAFPAVMSEQCNDRIRNSISIQTERAFFPVDRAGEMSKSHKIKKRKSRTRSQQVSLPDSHLTLSEYLQKQRQSDADRGGQVQEKRRSAKKSKADDAKGLAILNLIHVGKIGTDLATVKAMGAETSTKAGSRQVVTTDEKSLSPDMIDTRINEPKPKHRKTTAKDESDKVPPQKSRDRVVSRDRRPKSTKGAGSNDITGDKAAARPGRKRKPKNDFSDNIDTGVTKDIKKEKISRDDIKRRTASERKLPSNSVPEKTLAPTKTLSTQKSSPRAPRERRRKEGEKKTSRRRPEKPAGKIEKSEQAEEQDEVKSDEPADQDKIVKKDLEKDKSKNPVDISNAKAQLITDEPAPDDGEQLDLRPPGDEELDQLEKLFADREEGIPEDIDPEIVAKVEEQIFEKIKYYKEIKSAVRLKSWFMKKKMKLRDEANAYTARFEGKLSSGRGGPGFTARLKVSMSKATRELSNYLSMIVPWESKIKNIESYFGTVVASYFTFLRWLFWINIVMSVICGVVIIMPEVLFGPDMGTVDHKSVAAGTETEASFLKTLWNFEGYAAVSPFFYGYYSSIKRFESGYRMPFAYMVGNLMIFAYSFITILRQIAENSKDEKASDKDDNFTFSWKAFSSWDYMIGNRETAKNKYKALVITIRESITDVKESAKKISRKLKFLRFLSNFMVLAVLASSTYAIFLTVDRSKVFEEKKKREGPDSVSWLQSNEVSLVLSLVTAFFPILFDIIANIEDYHPRVALQWSLKRIMVLYLLNLYTLYIALYGKIQDIEEAADEANRTFYEGINMSAIVPCDAFNIPTTERGNNSEIVATTSAIPPKNDTSPLCGLPVFVPELTCWETMVGQELVKLTVFDFVTTVALLYITEFFRAVIIRLLNACWCWDMELGFPCYAEFSLAENLLHLVYNQGMVWMGTLFCPVLPMVNLFKLVCLFYVRSWSVMVSNVPHERIFKAGSDNFYLMLLLFMLYVVMIPIAFAMVSIHPSLQCGPYQEMEYMYLIITEWFKEVFHESLFSILKYLTSAGALIPIFILLFLCIYYLSSSNNALQGTVLDMKKQLQYERTEGKKRVFNMNKNMAQQNAGSEDKKLSRSSSKLAIDKGKLSRSDSSQKLQQEGTEAKISMNALLNASRFVTRLKLRASNLQPPVEEG